MTPTSLSGEGGSGHVAHTAPAAGGGSPEESPAQAVAAAVHDINNPLFAILGMLEFLLDDAEPGTRTRERLELIRQSALEIKETAKALQERSATWEEGAP
jgi:signal transduction histidine kinase